MVDALSTKLNLFFGVRHFNSQWLPDNMRYRQATCGRAKQLVYHIFDDDRCILYVLAVFLRPDRG